MPKYGPKSEYLLPWLLAKNLFRPAAADTSVRAGVERLKMWRANLGAVAIIALSWPTRSPRGIVKAFVEDSARNVTIAVVAAVLLGGGLVIWASASSRSARDLVLYRAKAPAKRVLAAVAMYACALILLQMPVPILLQVPIFAWYALFMLTALFYLARYLFGTEELHPVLGPVVEIAVVSAATAIGVVTAGKELPAQAALAIAIGGWLTSTPLSLAEAWHHRGTLGLGFFQLQGAYREPTGSAVAYPSERAAPPRWEPITIPMAATPVRSIDTTMRYRRHDGSPATPLLLGEAVEIAMEMDHRWNATRQRGTVRSRDGDTYEVDAGAAAMAYETISMLVYHTVILPARHNVDEWHRVAGIDSPWRNSQRLTTAIGRVIDGSWRAAPAPPTWPPGVPRMDDATAGATAWALATFPEDDIWRRQNFVDLEKERYRSVKPWAFPTDRRVTVRLALALSNGSSPAACALLPVVVGLNDAGHDWSYRY